MLRPRLTEKADRSRERGRGHSGVARELEAYYGVRGDTGVGYLESPRIENTMSIDNRARAAAGSTRDLPQVDENGPGVATSVEHQAAAVVAEQDRADAESRAE